MDRGQFISIEICPGIPVNLDKLHDVHRGDRHRLQVQVRNSLQSLPHPDTSLTFSLSSLHRQLGRRRGVEFLHN